MRCQETTDSGTQCTRDAEEGREYCWQHPTGSRPEQVTDESIIDALYEHRGGVYLAADDLDCSHELVYRRIRNVEEVRQAYQIANGIIDDTAENKLAEAVENGEAWAIKFRLKQAADRGYGDSVEVNLGGQEGGEPIDVDLDSLDAEELDDLISVLSKALGDGASLADVLGIDTNPTE